MKRAEEIIRRAEERMRELDGARAKARLSKELWAKVAKCADAACMTAEDWVCRACRSWMKGRFDGVAYDEKLCFGTREVSATYWVKLPHGFDAAMVRQALSAATAWHEPRIPKATPQSGTERWVEGRDYVLAKCEG